jgi:hypothetical protein
MSSGNCGAVWRRAASERAFKLRCSERAAWGGLSSAFEAPAVVSGLNDIAVVCQTIEQRARHLGVYENARPFAKSKIGRYDDRSAFIEMADQMEQQLTAGLGKGEISEFVEYNEVPPGEIFGDPSLTAATRLSLKPVDEIGGVVEAAMLAGTNATAGDGYGEMSLAGSGPTH